MSGSQKTRRSRRSAQLALAATAACGLWRPGATRAANTATPNSQLTFTGGTSSDLNNAANYTPSVAPTSANDIVFNTNSPLAGTLSASINFGSVDDTNTGAATSITNSTAGLVTLTLLGGGNTVSGTATDALYLAPGTGTVLSVNNGSTGALRLNFSVAAGNGDGATINVGAGSTFNVGAGVVSNFATKAVTFTGSGTTNFAGSITGELSGATLVGTGATLNSSGGASLAAITFISGNLVVSGGLFTDTSQLTANGGANITVTTGGTFQQAGASHFQFGNAGTNVVNLNGGTIAQAGTGTGTASYVYVGHNTGQSTINLNSGEFDTNAGFYTDGTLTTNVINFNGAALKLTATVGDLLTGVGSKITLNDAGGGGGAVINTNTFNLGIPEVINHTAGTGAIDGGVTKQGTGTLTLSGANLYTGGTTVSLGTFNASNNSALGPSSNTMGVTLNPTVGNVATLNFTTAAPVIAGLSSTGAGTSSVGLSTGITLTVGGSAALSTTFAGTIGGAGGLGLAAGKLALNGNNTYTGGTTVAGGTLQANNATAALGAGTTTVNGATAVLAGGTVAAPGVTGGAVTLTSGTITAGTGATPGDTIGTLTVGTATTPAAVTLGGAVSYAVKLDGNQLATAPTVTETMPKSNPTGTVTAYSGASDELLISTLATSTGGTLMVNPVLVSTGAAAFAPGTTYVFVIANGTSPTAFDSLVLPAGTANAGPNGSTYALDTAPATNGGEDLLLDFTTAATPEPTSLLLAGLAAAPLALGRRRRPSTLA